MVIAFHSELAQSCGTNAAIIAWYIWKNVELKRDSGERRWLQSSYPKFRKNLPFLNEHAIKKTLEMLISKGIIVRCDDTPFFEQWQFDRSYWYTFTLPGMALMEQIIPPPKDAPLMMDNYEIIQSVKIGDMEFLIGEDVAAEHRFMCCDYPGDVPLCCTKLRYSNDYLDILQDFNRRIQAQINRMKKQGGAYE